MIDHFTQYVGSSPYGSPAVLCGIAHMQTDEGIWYPIGGTRAVPEALVKLGARTRRRIPHRHGHREDRHRRRRRSHRRRHRVRRRHRAARGGLELRFRPHASRTDQRRPSARALRAPRSYEPACSGVVLYLGLNKRYEHLAHHDFVFSRDPHEEFDFDLQARASPRPTRPAISRRPPAPSRDRAAGRRSALRARSHAVSAAASRLEADAAGVSPRHSGQAQDAPASMPDIEIAHRLRARRSRRRTSTTATTCSTARSTASPATGNFSARSSPATAARPARPLPRRRRRASRARHADGADVRLDRRRRARHGSEGREPPRGLLKRALDGPRPELGTPPAGPARRLPWRVARPRFTDSWSGISTGSFRGT